MSGAEPTEPMSRSMSRSRGMVGSNPSDLLLPRPAASADAMCTDLGRFREIGIPQSNPSNLTAQRPAASRTRTRQVFPGSVPSDTPCDLWSREIPRPAASGVHTYEETRAVRC